MSYIDNPISSSNQTIIPFCIMHYDNPITNTYLGFINYPIKIKTDKGETLGCKQTPSQYGKWKYYHRFFAVSSLVRPIPNGLKLFNAKKLETDPFNTKDVEYAYDPFNIQENAVSFLTWSLPVPHTVPLYLHISPDGNSYPSFEKHPPSIGDWKTNDMSPLYVLVNTETHPYTLDINLNPLPHWKLDSNREPVFLFKSDGDRCVPDLNGVTLQQCFLNADENIFGTSDGSLHLIDHIQKQLIQEQNNSPTIPKFFKSMPSYAIAIFIVIFTISIIICIVILNM